MPGSATRRLTIEFSRAEGVGWNEGLGVLVENERTVMKLWLWKNFVDGKPEYWAFDNPFPVRLDCGDPQTLGEPCGYAIFKESRAGRTDVSEADVLRRIAAAKDA
jgi:hypothetical protein